VVGGKSQQGRRYDPSGQAVLSFSAFGTIRQGRRYDLSGQVVRSVRASGTISQGRPCDPSGQAVRSIRADGTICQGRWNKMSGQAVGAVRAGGLSRQGRWYGRPHNTNIACQATLLQLSWAGRRYEPAHFSPWPHWALSRRVARRHPWLRQSDHLVAIISDCRESAAIAQRPATSQSVRLFEH
jgi:hypothetical protein